MEIIIMNITIAFFFFVCGAISGVIATVVVFTIRWKDD